MNASTLHGGSLLRFSSVLTTVLALLLVTASAAFATHDEWDAHADGEGFLLSIPEVLEIGGGITEADLSSDPTAHARGVGFLLAEDSISEVTIERDGVTQRDPAEGNNCAGPELPDPIDLLDAGCSYALGDTTGDNSSSEASAVGAKVGVTGADVTALIGFLLSHIPAEDMDAAIAQVESEILTPVTLALSEACLEVSGELSPVLGPVVEGAQALIDEIEEQGGDIFVIEPEEGTACDLLIRYVLDPPPLVDANGDGTTDVGDLIAVLKEQLAAALDGVSILDVTLAGSDSMTSETAAAITAAADALGMDVALPSLNLLGNLADVLLDIVTDYLTFVEGEVGEVINFDAVSEDIPAPSELVQTLRDAIPAEVQGVLGSPDPLLRVTGGKANPTATYDRDTEEATTSGTVAPLIIDLNDDLAALLQLSEQDPITIPEGGSQTIAEGTPLESTFTLAACTSEDGIENDDGLPGARIHCAGLELILLKGVIGDNPDTDAPDGGIELAGAAGTTEVFGALIEHASGPDEPRDMPTTGGGLALLGLVAIGGAVALRRRG